MSEIHSHGWEVIASGDFNAAPHPINYGRPDHYKECPALLYLLSTDVLTDSFQSANPDTIDFSWSRMAKHQYLCDRHRIDALDGHSMDMIMSLLPPWDRNNMSSASCAYYQCYCCPVIIQKCIDLILASPRIRLAAATIDTNTAIDSDHTPVTLSIPL